MEEDRKTIFEPVLGSDETIIETFKPNKTREVVISSIFTGLLLFIVGAIPFTFGLLGLIEVIEFTSEISDEFGNITEVADPLAALPTLIFGCIIFVILALAILYNIVSYKKKWFCYTNKRIIVRSGFIGVDYQTLDYDLIGGISVNVSLFDKMVKPETGTISFASAASPVIQNSKGVSSYRFTSIEHPYDVYKRIKEYFDNVKAAK